MCESNCRRLLGLIFLLCVVRPELSSQARPVWSQGAIIRGDTTRKVIHLLFSGHEYADGGETIAAILRRHRVKASFFFTGDFYRTPAFSGLIQTLQVDGHYLGPHSDRHLLYASWENRDSLLVTRTLFTRDLWNNYGALRSFGVEPRAARFFLPPFEWYNDRIAAWCRDSGVVLINFSPGTSSNADYTTPDMGVLYVPSDTIFERILRYESTHSAGLNGFHLLMHVGTHPSRTDKMMRRLEDLILELARRGYRWERIDANPDGGIQP